MTVLDEFPTRRLPKAVCLLAALAVALTTAVVGVTPTVAVAAPPAATCENPSDPGQVIQQTPWQQKWLAPERVWPFSTGAGVQVAVIDSGTDPNHEQLKGQVLTGFDALRGADGGNIDCVSHGTAVASIIAARHQDGVGFQGLAPGVTILPVRISEKETEQNAQRGSTVDPAKFAGAIKWAVDRGAKVINLSVVMYSLSAELQEAVKYARSKDVVLVAAAGNEHREDGLPDPVPYPAALDGVIGVGAIDENGARVAKSQVGSYVDLVAPGGAVVAATRIAGHNLFTGTSFAAPMVAAAAALVRAAEPGLTADEVTRRLLATADPSRGGLGSDAYGHGVVNLYRAVTERLSTAAPQVLPPLPARSHDPVAEEHARVWSRIGGFSLVGSAGVGALVVLVVFGALVLPKGRRSRWRPTRRSPVPEPVPDREDPEEVFYRLPLSGVADR